MFGLNLESVQYYEEHRGCQTVNGNGVECAKVSPVVQSSGPVHRASPPITDSRLQQTNGMETYYGDITYHQTGHRKTLL